MTEPIISTENLFYHYGDGTEALRGISVSFQRGKKIAVLGNNGAGKSTLFLHLNGVLKPSSGSILFKGKPLQYKKRDLLTLRKEVGIVFQNPEEQLFSPTVFDDIAYGPRNLGLSRKEVAEMVYWAMEETGTLDLQKRSIHFLSLGQKKRVAIAGVLAMDPKLMILDEPTAGLDGYYSKKIMQLLHEIHLKGKTIVLSTHDMNLAYEWADEVLILNNGQVLGNGGREIFQREDLLRIAQLEKPTLLEFYEHFYQNLAGKPHGEIPRTKEALFALLQ